jgi:hypothetical protein
METMRVYSVAESQVSKYVILNLDFKVLNYFSFTNINLAHIFIRHFSTSNLKNVHCPDFFCRFKSFILETA